MMHLLGAGNGGLLGAAGTTLAAGKVLLLAGNLLRGFWTTSVPSVRINSMWQGLDM